MEYLDRSFLTDVVERCPALSEGLKMNAQLSIDFDVILCGWRGSADGILAGLFFL